LFSRLKRNFRHEEESRLRIMAGRLTVFAVFTFLGFFGGVLFYFAYKRVFPFLLQIFPELLNAEWFLTGMAGAVMTVVLITVWATISPTK